MGLLLVGCFIYFFFVRGKYIREEEKDKDMIKGENEMIEAPAAIHVNIVASPMAHTRMSQRPDKVGIKLEDIDMNDDEAAVEPEMI
jgi:hypothetical protein